MKRKASLTQLSVLFCIKPAVQFLLNARISTHSVSLEELVGAVKEFQVAVGTLKQL
jgi:hypothetical protein